MRLLRRSLAGIESELLDQIAMDRLGLGINQPSEWPFDRLLGRIYSSWWVDEITSMTVDPLAPTLGSSKRKRRRK